jgi:succinyl-CoA synthetase alpha subunit
MLAQASSAGREETFHGRHPLDVFFAPQSVAVFGASEEPGSLGRALLTNLIHNLFGGVVFPINPQEHGVLGIKAYPSLTAVPQVVDLAILATPSPTVPDVLQECQAEGVSAAIVLPAAFADRCPAGTELERQVRACLGQGPMRVLGLNSFGIACPRTRFNANFAPDMVPGGKIGFLSQSGALLTALLRQEQVAEVGCSALVGVGSHIDIGWAEWIDYLARDPHTQCLGIYLERLADPGSFFPAVRGVARHKPVILVKGSGKTPEGAEASRSGRGLAPLSRQGARELIEQSRVPMLQGQQAGAPLDLEALEEFLLGLGRLLADHPSIKEIKIPALHVRGQGVLPREVKCVLQEPEASGGAKEHPEPRSRSRLGTFAPSGTASRIFQV